MTNTTPVANDTGMTERVEAASPGAAARSRRELNPDRVAVKAAPDLSALEAELAAERKKAKASRLHAEFAEKGAVAAEQSRATLEQELQLLRRERGWAEGELGRLRGELETERGGPTRLGATLPRAHLAAYCESLLDQNLRNRALLSRDRALLARRRALGALAHAAAASTLDETVDVDD